MRLTQAFYFYFGDGDLTKSQTRVQYSHFHPSSKDYALRAKLAKEERKEETHTLSTKVLVELFED